MKDFGLALYSNVSLLKVKRTPILIVMLMFLINVMILSSPLFGARAETTGESVVSGIEGLEEAFNEIYELQLPCVIDNGISCADDYNHSDFNGFELVVEGEPKTGQYIAFYDDVVVIANSETTVFGDYTFINGYTLNPENNYAEYTEALMFAVVSANLANDYFYVFIGQFVQNILYILAISLLLLVANYRQKQPLITYRESVSITVLAMTGPALLSSLIGLFLPHFFMTVFMAVYSIRMMYLYFALFRWKKA